MNSSPLRRMRPRPRSRSLPSRAAVAPSPKPYPTQRCMPPGACPRRALPGRRPLARAPAGQPTRSPRKPQRRPARVRCASAKPSASPILASGLFVLLSAGSLIFGSGELMGPLVSGWP